jgi:hypothetical protein
MNERLSTRFIRSYVAFMFLMLASVGMYTNSFPEIKTKKELEKVLEEERKKLGLTTQEISIKFGESFYDAQVQRIGDNRYEITLDELRDRQTVRHELYHIYKGHADADIKGISTWENLTKEIKCDFYGFFGVKL